jgi:MscS family membrane protein
MKHYSWIFLLLLGFFCTASQSKTPLFDYNLNSPYDTIVTHLGFLKAGNYYPEIASETFCQQHRTQQEAVALAIQLQQLLQENRVSIDLSQVPQDVHYIDQQAKYHRYQLTEVFPEIYLVKVNNKWIYSEETARRVAEHAQKKVYPLGMQRLQQWLPDSFKKTLLGLYMWQYALLLCLMFVSILVYRITIFLSPRWLSRTSKSCNTTHVRRVTRFTSFLMAVLVVILVLPAMQLPAAMTQYAIRVLKGVLTLTMTVVCYQWINVLIPHVAKKIPQNTRQLNVQLTLLARPFMKVLVILIGLLLMLKVFSLDVSSTLAGMSIGGIGFALASQDTIKNFFGTLAICIDRPFSIGDTITTGNIEGIVEEIGLRATRIRTYHQSVIYVPNAKLIDTHVDNHGLRNYSHCDVHIAIPHDTDPTLTAMLMERISEIAVQRAYIREDQHAVYLEGIQNSMLKILLRVHFFVDHQYSALRCRHEVFSDITKLTEELGIRLLSLTP